jgi:Leucine-rich repeat (LRR) protein
MKNLRALNFYENQISSLEFDVFHSLLNLEYLDLDNNQISELHPDLFLYNPDLKILRLRENKLEALSDNIFRSNRNIEQIHLNGNHLKNVNVDFTLMENLLAVNLENNYDGCDLSVGFYENIKDNDNEDKLEILMEIFQRNVESKCRQVE